jgi:hypothetical protein
MTIELVGDGGEFRMVSVQAIRPRVGDVLEVLGRDEEWVAVGLRITNGQQRYFAEELLRQHVGHYRLRRDGVIVATND